MGNLLSFGKESSKMATSQAARFREILIPQDGFSDQAFGCVIGAMCGDALGVPVEFRNQVTLQQAEECLRYPGGGPFRIGRGQITDDTEMALSLAHGLVQGKGIFDVNKIAGMYHEWYKSNPFDIGITTRNALCDPPSSTGEHAKVIRNGALRSAGSQSNGGLMRITPLCVWSSKLSQQDLIKAVREDTRLTHPNVTAQNVSIAYVYAINHLLNHPGENLEAYEKCKDLVINVLKDQDIAGWIQELEAGQLPLAIDKIGWVKIAFLYSLDFLRKKTEFEEAMKIMLTKGGDTDTNCCIVGGMLGALHGYSGIPKRLTDPVISFEAEKVGGIRRPDFLVPAKCAEWVIREIIKIRPSSLTMQGEEKEDERKTMA